VVRRQFETYLDKVFGFADLVAALPEGRMYPVHPWKKVFDAVFLGSACQFATVHRIEFESKAGMLSKRIGPLSEDTMGYAMQRQDIEPLFELGCTIAKRLKRNGVIDSTWARGRVVAAVDGIEICNSYSRCCDTCLERKVEKKVDGEICECLQYYHRISAVTVVSTPFPVCLGIRFQQDGETEVACSQSLLQQLVEQLGRRFIDVLVADALYLQTPFVGVIEALDLDWVINLKDNQPALLAEAECLTAVPASCQWSDGNDDFSLWHLPQVDWPVANRVVHVVKTVRVRKTKRIKIEKVGELRDKRKQEVSLQSTNLYASNVDLGSIPPVFIHQLGRSRWTIDVTTFQTLTTDCHLKQPSVHQDVALVVLTMIRVMAYTLMMIFYQRQVRSHCRKTPPSFCESARSLAQALFTTGADTG
jgi:hypothetical protein